MCVVPPPPLYPEPVAFQHGTPSPPLTAGKRKRPAATCVSFGVPNKDLCDTLNMRGCSTHTMQGVPSTHTHKYYNRALRCIARNILTQRVCECSVLPPRPSLWFP